MDNRLVPWLPQVVYLRHYGSIFRNPLSNVKPVALVGGGWEDTDAGVKSDLLSFKPALHKTNIADNVQKAGGHTSKNPPRQAATAGSIQLPFPGGVENKAAYVQPVQEPNMVGDDILLRKHLSCAQEPYPVCLPIRGNPQILFRTLCKV